MYKNPMLKMRGSPSFLNGLPLFTKSAKGMTFILQIINGFSHGTVPRLINLIALLLNCPLWVIDHNVKSAP